MDTHSALVCTLPIAGMAAQLGEWAALQDAAMATEPVSNGVAITLPLEMHGSVEDLAAREAACCSFLEVRTVIVDGLVRLEITSDVPGAGNVIALLAGDRA